MPRSPLPGADGGFGQSQKSAAEALSQLTQTKAKNAAINKVQELNSENLSLKNLISEWRNLAIKNKNLVERWHAEHDTRVKERDQARKERDQLQSAHNELIANKDAIVGQRDAMYQTLVQLHQDHGIPWSTIQAIYEENKNPTTDTPKIVVE